MAPYQSLDLVYDVCLLLAADHQENEVEAPFAHASELDYAVDASVPVDVPLHHYLVLAALNSYVFLLCVNRYLPSRMFLS